MLPLHFARVGLIREDLNCVLICRLGLSSLVIALNSVSALFFTVNKQIKGQRPTHSCPTLRSVHSLGGASIESPKQQNHLSGSIAAS